LGDEILESSGKGAGIWDLRSVRSVGSGICEVCEICGVCEDSSKVNILSKLLTMSNPLDVAGKAIEDLVASVTPDFGSAKYPLLGVGTVVSMGNSRIGAAIITAGGLTWAEEGGWMPAWFHLPWAKMTDERRREFNVAWGVKNAAFTDAGTYTETMNPSGLWENYNVGSAGVDAGDVKNYLNKWFNDNKELLGDTTGDDAIDIGLQNTAENAPKDYIDLDNGWVANTGAFDAYPVLQSQDWKDTQSALMKSDALVSPAVQWLFGPDSWIPDIG
jgi:hypothetical protein